MNIAAWGKRIVLLLFLTVAHALFGLACQRIQFNYPTLIAQRSSLILLATWLFLSLLSVTTVAALVAALVRPYRAILLGFAIATFVMLIFWGINRDSLIAALVYWLIISSYAYFVARESDNSIRFSLQPVICGQNQLGLALVLVVAVSFAMAYDKSIAESETIIPAVVQRAVTNTTIRLVEGRLEDLGLQGTLKNIAVQEIKNEVDLIWSGFEKAMAPFAPLFPFILGGAVAIFLEILFFCFGWLPAIVLEILFWLLPRLHLIQSKTETRQVQRFVLD